MIEGVTRRWPQLAVALGVLAIGVVVLVQTQQIATTLYARVGPKVFPTATGIALVAIGAFLAVQTLIGWWRTDVRAEHGQVDWPRFAILLIGLAVNLALIGPVGFVVASSLMFILVARAFGSRSLLRDAVTAVLLALTAFLLFELALGVRIGTGVVDVAIGGAVRQLLAIGG